MKSYYDFDGRKTPIRMSLSELAIELQRLANENIAPQRVTRFPERDDQLAQSIPFRFQWNGMWSQLMELDGQDAHPLLWHQGGPCTCPPR